MKQLIVFILILNGITINAQNDSVRRFYKEDFNTFIQLLEETHPDPYTALAEELSLNDRHKKYGITFNFQPIRMNTKTIYPVLLHNWKTDIQLFIHQKTSRTKKI